MREYITFTIGAIIFFSIGTIFAFLDTLFQDEFTDNESAGRGFWTTLSLITISVAAIILIHYLFVNSKNGGTEAKSQFINIHAHETKALDLSTIDTVGGEGFSVGA
uniref:Uncharacterized protein n=1 Tax=Pithovirus LCPAC304 TaxID=2506594 RepID=A0A481Z9U4_9VIRU|nr:MAG: hypothetical protein LCPAC304_06020 [Pithovirus LCPAC304]